MFKLFLLVVCTIIFIGCNNTTSESSEDNVSVSSSSLDSISSSSSVSSSISFDESNDSLTIQGIILNELLETPIRIIDNESDLNTLYSDLNIEKNENITPDFTTDRVIYLQRYGLSIGWKDGKTIEQPLRTSINIETNSVRISSIIEMKHGLSAKIILLKDVNEKSFFFTQEVLSHVNDSYEAYKEDVLYNRELNITKLIGVYPDNAKNTVGALSQDFEDSDRLDLYFSDLGMNEDISLIDFENNIIISSGSMTDNSQITYKDAKLEEFFVKKTVIDGLNSNQPLELTTDVLVFKIEGVKNDCEEFNSTKDDNILLFSLPKDKATSTQADIYSRRLISVKSCTGYMTTPPIEEVKWYEYVYVEL